MVWLVALPVLAVVTADHQLSAMAGPSGGLAVLVAQRDVVRGGRRPVLPGGDGGLSAGSVVLADVATRRRPTAGV